MSDYPNPLTDYSPQMSSSSLVISMNSDASSSSSSSLKALAVALRAKSLGLFDSNLVIRRCGNKVAPMTMAEVTTGLAATSEQLPPFWNLFTRDQLLWTVVGILLAIPGLLFMMTAHQMVSAATIAFEAGTLITGITVLSCFPAVRMYLSEQFPTDFAGVDTSSASRLRGCAGVIAPFVMASHTGSPGMFFSAQGLESSQSRLRTADIRQGDIG